MPIAFSCFAGCEKIENDESYSEALLVDREFPETPLFVTKDPKCADCCLYRWQL
jgi:hypothetical protein